MIKYMRGHQLAFFLLLSVVINLMQLKQYISQCRDNAVLNYRLMMSEQTNDSLRMADVKYFTLR